MKKFKFLFLGITLSCFMVACGGNTPKGTNQDATEAAHGASKEYTSAYVCPMHCKNSGSDQAGTCPACGMDYVAQKEHTKNGHNH